MSSVRADDALASLRELCADVGFDFDGAGPLLAERTRLLTERSETLIDAMRMVSFARAFRRFYEAESTSAFSAIEWRTIVLGCLFSDIGKTGPVHADRDGQRLVVDMFAVEGVRDPAMSVAAFFAMYFPDEVEPRVERFAALALDPAMTMRAFWNLHSEWTLDIAEQSGLPLEAVGAAATHHLLDDVNPQSIVGADGRFTRSFGDNARFDRAEKLIIVLDKYDAARRRGSLSHAEAIAWLKKRISANAHYRDDVELATLVDDLDRVLGLTPRSTDRRT